MGDINALLEIDFTSVLIGLFVGLFAIKSVISVIEWFCVKLGIETKWNRQKREERELLTSTVNAVKELKETHEKDKKEVNNKNYELENVLTIFMDEMRDTYTKTQNEIKEFNEKQIEYRGVSIERERRLNERINEMFVSDECRDDEIHEIGTGLKKLTDMFIDKQINDYRWEIINFASNITAKRPCTKDGYQHCFKTYERYEKILEENGLENGEVEISMEIINDSYKEKLKEGF